MIENCFNVPKKQWKKWDVAGKIVFNEVYATMLNHQDLFRHPKSEFTPQNYWNTTCWNAAWIAANYATNPNP